MNDTDILDQLQKLYAVTSATTPWNVTIDGSALTSSTISNVKDYAIKGEMLMVSHIYDDFTINEVGKDEIRRQMAELITRELLASKMMEFTQMTEPITGKKIIKARAFIVPSDQVQILRTNGY